MKRRKEIRNALWWAMAIAGLAACQASVDDALTGNRKPGGNASNDNPSNGTTPNSGDTTGTPAGGSTSNGGPINPDGGAPPATLPNGREPTEEDIFLLAGLPSGEAQLAKLCARGGTNKLTTAFCGAAKPTITGLADLQRVMGLAFPANAPTGRNNNAQNGNPGFVLMGHSSSLVARFTNSINPRTVVFTPSGRNRVADFVTMGFVRGEQFAEVVAADPTTGVNRFFLVQFEQACNVGHKCTAGDLLTPAVEKNWTGLTIYEDVDLKNTIADCTHCHQPAAAGPKMLRFQELRNPWTHMFRNNNAGGQALLADFHAAHGTTEDYGFVPANQIDSSEPAELEDFVRGQGFAAQPNEFDSNDIEDEIENSAPGQPQNNATPGTSATWNALYDRFVQGQVIAPPYHDVKVTDPLKLQTMTAAYRAVAAGTTPVAQLPDIRKAFLDQSAWAMGFAAKPGLTGAQLLTQMCTACHNPNLDQTITRARFDVSKLATMSRAEKDIAIDRVKLAATNPRRMPPARFRDLTAAEAQLVIQELAK